MNNKIHDKAHTIIQKDTKRRMTQTKLIHKNTRNSSGDEIVNVNFLYDDIVHELQNTIDSCIRSTRYVLERMCLPNLVK